MFDFDLQLFGGGGKGGSSSSRSYTPSPQQQQLIQYAVDNAGLVQPIISNLLTQVGTNIGNADGFSFNNNAIDYENMYNKGASQVAQSQSNLSSLANGQLTDEQVSNMSDAIRSTLGNTMGSMVNSLGNRGVMNSSVTTKAMNDLSKNASNAVAQNYNQTISNLAGVNSSNINSAGAGLQLGSNAQQLALTPTDNLLKYANGLNSGFVTNALGALSGTGTSTQKDGGASFGDMLTSMALGFGSKALGLF